MMSAAPPPALTREQISRLQAYLQTYRRYTLASLMPSATRNNTLRLLQGIQGKLIDALDQKTALLPLILTTEEITTLKAITAELLTHYAQEPASAERDGTLVDLAGLKATLERYR